MATVSITSNSRYYTSNNDTLLGKTKNLFRALWKGEETTPAQTIQMRYNISLADEAILHTRRQIVLVPNFASDLFYQHIYSTDALNEKLHTHFSQNGQEALRATTDQALNRLPPVMNNTFIRALVIARYAEKYSIGACHELAISAFAYLAYKGVRDISVHKIIGKDGRKLGDHVFLIVGKGSDAVVMDPWLQKSYPFAELHDHLQDYKGFDETLQPVLVPFNPKTQQLEHLVEAVLQPEEIESSSARDQLELYWKASDPSERTKYAEKTLETLLKQNLLTRKEALLYWQLLFQLDPLAVHKKISQILVQ